MRSPQKSKTDVSPFCNGAEPHAQTQQTPIAVIGYAGRFPKAETTTQFWNNMDQGIDGVGDIPPERWDSRAYFDKRPATAFRTYCNQGGFLKNIDYFDNAFFSIPEDEARCIDPKQRVLMQTAYHGLEHAGYGGDTFCGTNTGVFIGSSYYHHEHEMPAHRVVSPFGMLGTSNTLLANRISHVFNFKGPSCFIDTFCSSSLMAVHLACQSLNRGECRTALAGGVHLLSLIHYISLSQFRALSATGRCKSFDQSADGFVPGEGVGIVVLKPMPAALEDRDTIHGIIKGAAINHTGRTNSLTSPSAESQSRLIEAAYANAGVDFDSISYIETHGTGTELGDPLEIKALKNIFSNKTNGGRRCVLGSVKSSIGHLEPASGIAGLIKVLLCLKHKQIPGVLHLNQLNRFINLKKSPFEINTRTIDWQSSDGPRRAGISSFGLSGTNVHMVVEQPAHKKHALRSAPANKLRLYTLSTRSGKGLRRLVRDTIDALNDYSEEDLDDLCFTQAVGRRHFNMRASILFNGIEDLKQQLDHLSQTPASEGLCKTEFVNRPIDMRHKITVAFGGDLQIMVHDVAPFWRYPVFCKTFNQAIMEINKYTHPCNTLAIKGDDPSCPAEIQGGAPYLHLAIAIAMFQLLRSWGLEFVFITGYGIGFIAAALAARAIGWKTALTLENKLRNGTTAEAKMTIEFPPDIALVPSPIWTAKQSLSVGDQIALTSNTGNSISRESVVEEEPAGLFTPLIVLLGSNARDHIDADLPQDIRRVHLPPTWSGLCGGLGQLYAHGIHINWLGFYRPETADRVPLPNYPFDGIPLNFNNNQRPTIMNMILNPAEKNHRIAQPPGIPEKQVSMAQATGTTNTDDVAEYLINAVSRKAGVAAQNFNTHTRFEQIGMDSIMKVELSYEIMERFSELEQAGNALLEAATVNEFIEIIMGFIGDGASLPTKDDCETQSFPDLDLLHAGQKRRLENLASRSCTIADQSLTAELTVNEQHPFFFDHPLDHVSGVHQLEAMVQAVTTAHHAIGSQLSQNHLFFKDMHVDFKHLCSKTGSAQIKAHRLEFIEGCTDSKFYTASINGPEKVYCNAFFKVQALCSNDLDLMLSVATPSENTHFDACEKNKVHKDKAMNVLISEPVSPAGRLQEMTFELRPVGDHPYFSDYPGEYVPSIFFLEAFRQTQRYLQQMQPDEPNAAENRVSFLLSLTLSLDRPVGRHEATQIKIDRVEPKSVGHNLLVNATGRIMRGKTTLGFCRNQNMVLIQN